MSFKSIQKLNVQRTLTTGEAISQFTHLAQQQAISKTTVLAIEKTLAERKQENAALLV